MKNFTHAEIIKIYFRNLSMGAGLMATLLAITGLFFWHWWLVPPVLIIFIAALITYAEVT